MLVNTPCDGGSAGEIAPVAESCPVDAFENSIRKFGVVAACEWFGHAPDSDFTKETIRELDQRKTCSSLCHKDEPCSGGFIAGGSPGLPG